MQPRALTVLVALCLAAFHSPADAAGWKAGVAKVKITPRQPIWMSGYASRDRPAEGTLHELWAKALALEDAEGRRVVLVTADLCGIDRDVSGRVRGAIRSRHNLGPADVALCVSHTHTGPVVGSNLRPMYFLDERQGTLVDEYTRELEGKLVAVAGEALGALSPARLEWGRGTTTFAVNRRANREEDVVKLREAGALKGPTDHDLPVLAVRAADNGVLKAVVFGYACHATTLSFYQWSGDWPGFAQIELEKAHPGATALFVAGCGADQNPLPRRAVPLAQQYGQQAAMGVESVLKSGAGAVAGRLRTAHSEIELPFASLPARADLETDAAGKDRYVANRARFLLQRLDREGKLPAAYPYPIQVWRLGDEVTVVFLGGEVVVDYAPRLKSDLGPGRTWVAAYANDVMAYIPSERVLKEGGYEGGGAMVYYGLPSPWAAGIEERIVREAHRLASEVAQ